MTVKRTALPPLALVLLWFAAAWWPARAMVASEQARLDDLQSQQLAMVSTLNELATAEELTPRFEEDLERIDAAVPDQLRMSSLLRQFDAEADAAGIQIELFTPTEVLISSSLDRGRLVPAGMSAVALSLTGQGPFEATLDFVGRIQALPRLVVIDRLGLRTVDDGAGEIIIDIDFRIFTTESMAPSTGTVSVPADEPFVIEETP